MIGYCTMIVHNTAQNSSDNLHSYYPPDNHHNSNVSKVSKQMNLYSALLKALYL